MRNRGIRAVAVAAAASGLIAATAPSGVAAVRGAPVPTDDAIGRTVLSLPEMTRLTGFGQPMVEDHFTCSTISSARHCERAGRLYDSSWQAPAGTTIPWFAAVNVTESSTGARAYVAAGATTEHSAHHRFLTTSSTGYIALTDWHNGSTYAIGTRERGKVVVEAGCTAWKAPAAALKACVTALLNAQAAKSAALK